MKTATYQDLQKIPTIECNEPFTRFMNCWMRQGCMERLKKAKEIEPRIHLVEAYRSLKTQKQLFIEQLEKGRSIEETHALIAVPDVAGHPTGGAVDVTLLGKDMGGEIKDFSHPERLPTYSTHVTREQMTNRLQLRKAMLIAGFAPYNGEWWHFSYGDKEWAYYYNKPNAIYVANNQLTNIFTSPL